MNPEARKYLASIGAKGGAAGTGKSKARTKAQARAAAKARWSKTPKRRMPNDKLSHAAGDRDVASGKD